MSWVEVQFLQKAVDELQKSRQILMFTYVFAFYLRQANITTIFEDNQVSRIFLKKISYVYHKFSDGPTSLGPFCKLIRNKLYGRTD